MTCLQFRSILDQYIDQELSADDKQSADDHLRECSSCRDELASHQGIKTLLVGHLPPLRPTEEYWDQSRERILARTVQSAEPYQKETDTSTGTRSYIPVMRSVFSVAASVALLVTALILGSRHERPAVMIGGQGAEIIITANMAEMLNTPESGPLTRGEQLRVGQASILLGGPGMAGRFNYFPGLMRIY